VGRIGGRPRAIGLGQQSFQLLVFGRQFVPFVHLLPQRDVFLSQLRHRMMLNDQGCGNAANHDCADEAELEFCHSQEFE
jgi:hypothetical protein